MIVSTWSNGRGSYGVKIAMKDRLAFFKKDWQSIALTLEGFQQTISVNIDKESFWTVTCGELISKDIGLWLKANNIDTWPPRKPHHLELKPLPNNQFLLCKP